MKPQPVDWNKVEKVLLSNRLFFYNNTKSGSSHPRDENDFSGRKNAMYGHWMSSSWNVEEQPQIQHYLKRELPPRVIRNMARFRTSSHYLKVETDRWKRPKVPWKDRVCDLCDLGLVQDEHHVIFECCDEALLNARINYHNLISQSENRMIPLHFLMNNPDVEGCEKLPLLIDACMRRMDQVYFDKNASVHSDLL